MNHIRLPVCEYLQCVLVGRLSQNDKIVVSICLIYQFLHVRVYQDIKKEEYDVLLNKMPKEVDWTKLSEYESMDMTIGSQELACAAGNCEIQ